MNPDALPRALAYLSRTTGTVEDCRMELIQARKRLNSHYQAAKGVPAMLDALNRLRTVQLLLKDLGG